VECYNRQAELKELMAEERNVWTVFGVETSHKIPAWKSEKEMCN